MASAGADRTTGRERRGVSPPVWDLAEQKLLSVLETHTETLVQVRSHPDCPRVASSADNGTERVLTLKTKQLLENR